MRVSGLGAWSGLVSLQHVAGPSSVLAPLWQALASWPQQRQLLTLPASILLEGVLAKVPDLSLIAWFELQRPLLESGVESAVPKRQELPIGKQ